MSAWRRRLSPTGNAGDAVFRALMFGAALLLLLIVGAMILALASHSTLSIRKFGFGFLTGREWNPVKGQFGALAFIYGTVASSLIALLISVPLSLGIAIFLVEQAPHFVARPITFLVELLAAIPSVVYGLWGIFVLAPFLRVHELVNERELIIEEHSRSRLVVEEHHPDTPEPHQSAAAIILTGSSDTLRTHAKWKPGPQTLFVSLALAGVAIVTAYFASSGRPTGSTNVNVLIE